MRKILITLLFLIAVLLAIPQVAFAIGEPTVTITLDKESVRVGETVTATYEISGNGTYTNVGWDWWIETEDGKSQSVIVEDDQTSSKMKDSFSISPQFGSFLSCSLWVVEDTGRGYWFDSDQIEIIGDNSKEPEIVIELDKEEASIGEKITATYKISGDGVYTNIGWDWWIETEDGKSQSIIVEDNQHSSELQGNFSIEPKFGNNLYCSLWVNEDTGRAYWFESKTIPISGYALGYDIYSVIEGQNTQISTGETNLTFRADGEFEKYLGIQVDNSTVPSKYVKSWSGSTYVELSAEYLASLPDGEHELIIVFEDGVAVTKFATEKKIPELPQTGDMSNVTLYVMLAAFSTICLMIMAKKRRTE